MNGLAHHKSVSTELDVAPVCGTWFACLEDGNASLRIAHKDILGATAEGEPCFSVKSAAHAIQFIRISSSLFVGHRAGSVLVDGEATHEVTRVTANSKVQLGTLTLTISSEPLSSNDLVPANGAAERAQAEVMAASEIVPQADSSKSAGAITVSEPIPTDQPHTAKVSVLPSKRVTKPELTIAQAVREPSQDKGQDKGEGDGFSWSKLAYVVPVVLLGLFLAQWYFAKQEEAFTQPTVSASANSGLVERTVVSTEELPEVALPDLPAASIAIVEPELAPVADVVNEPETEITESPEPPATEPPPTLAMGVPQDSQQARPNETIAVDAAAMPIEWPVVAEVEPAAESRPAPDQRVLPIPTAAALMAAAGQALNRGDATVAKRLLDEALEKAPTDARINKLHRQLSYILAEVSVQSEQQENIQ